jgi:NAD(P)-dependent dehydrogenase (short-subunit alcohol dehydrogenase family)
MVSLKESFYLEDRVAVITGGAGILGEKHAEAIAEFGGIPILIDIDKTNAQKKADSISKKYGTKCEYFHCDITNEKQIIDIREKLLSKYNHVDILINNAAIDSKVESKSKKSQSRLESFSLDQWNLEISVGLTGAMLCSRVFGENMAKKGKGVILNIASDLGVIAPDQRIYKKKGFPDAQQPVKPVTYSVVKHGLIGLTKYLASYWANNNVRVNAISPGGIYNNQDPEFVSKLTNLIPMGRMAQKDEYKAAIIFLISDASSYMNGANLIIDGGRSII